MSKLSNNYGRAYEFAYLHTLNGILKLRGIESVVEENSCYFASKKAWDAIDKDKQKTFLLSATAGINALIDAEPIILDDSDTLEIKLQPDSAGKTGDIRDIIIIRKGIRWEIGISVKHNHFAVKHSRLSEKLDFGEKWFGVKCSDDYWRSVTPIFDYLTKKKDKKAKWSELPSKENDVYIPLLNAFLNEIKNSYSIHGGIVARKMVEYLLGQYDFYKVIGLDSNRTTQIQPYNLRGTLNKESKSHKPKLIIPVSGLPTRIVSAEFKPDSSNTVEIYMDEGWQFGFRIHNAETFVIPSLKFDVRIIGMPATIICIDCKWE